MVKVTISENGHRLNLHLGCRVYHGATWKKQDIEELKAQVERQASGGHLKPGPVKKAFGEFYRFSFTVAHYKFDSVATSEEAAEDQREEFRHQMKILRQPVHR